MRTDKRSLQLYAEMLDRRSVRERVLILLTFLVLLLVAWNFLIFEPALAARRKTVSGIGQLKSEILQLKAEKQIIQQQAEVDPDRENRQQITQLQELIGDFDRKLEARLINLLSPQQMPVLLQKILKQQKGLHLIAMENLPPESILPQAEGEAPRPGLYRHALSMEVEGSYLRLLNYLETLERMPQRVFWDILTIDNKGFPVARIHLQLHTLSLSEDWIGV